MKYLYKRDRSDFWVTIHDNEESYTIATKDKYVDVINFAFPVLEEDSPTGWRQSDTYAQMSSLWLPKRYCNEYSIECIKDWSQKATQEVLWLYLGKNISDYFKDELDFCIASDFNFVYGNGRTELGEAEYQLKYYTANISNKERDKYVDIIMKKMLDNCKYIPITKKSDFYISPMPAAASEKKKLARIITTEMANQMNISLIDPSLIRSKPEMKQLAVADRIKIWREIYNNNGVQLDKDVCGKDIILIDDLYQSGATMWQYASFLKKMGARRVFGVVCVKSLKDSDNT